MIVVSDTTPIISLLKVNKLDLLEKLFSNVLVPLKVYDELVSNKTFSNERLVLAKCNYIKVLEVKDKIALKQIEEKSGLDQGESEALQLYKEQNADLLIVDEHKGRAVAKSMAIKHIGTIGILMQAFDTKLLKANEVKECLDIMLESSIRLDKSLYNKVIKYVGL